jgi:hypothetical protein
MNPYNPPPSPYAPPGAAAPPYPMGMMQQGAGPGAPGTVGEIAVEMLRQTRPWVMFLSILSFVFAAFALLGGLMMLVAGAIASSASSGGPPMALLGLVYLPLAALYVYPGIKLWSYGSAIGRLVASRASGDLEAALQHQKSFWKFTGIAAIVVIVFYVIFFFVMMAVGFTAASHMR